MSILVQVNEGEPASSGAALYVDTENLREADHAQEAIAQAVTDWPGPLPLGSLSLYVRADKVAVWEMWAEQAYPDLRVRVRGVQHFSNHKAKNSADLAITADAVADLITGQAAAVAVVSNDSDFGALFVKVRELARAAGLEQTPFLWITSPDAGALSPEMERFIPAGLRWDLSDTIPAAAPSASPEHHTPGPEPRTRTPESHTRHFGLSPEPQKTSRQAASLAVSLDFAIPNETIAEELIRQLPVGKFKVTDALDVFQARWRQHPAAAGPAQFGTFLLKEVWPVLQKRGVLMTRKSSPRTYEITQGAKDTIAKAPPKPSRQGETAPEPLPSRLAATVAAAITDDLFSATAAQPAIKSRWPQHPAASYTAAQFGTWFARQLWPIMEMHGVTLASEKPRRYEMTPDARHRLAALA